MKGSADCPGVDSCSRSRSRPAALANSDYASRFLPQVTDADLASSPPPTETLAETAVMKTRVSRLRENRDKLLRTGVYGEQDPVVMSLTNRMEELQRQIPVETFSI